MEKTMRCYNGCPDSALQTVIDRLNGLKANIRKHEPEAHLTFHNPHGNSAGGYVVHVWGRELSGYHPFAESALLEAITLLQHKH